MISDPTILHVNGSNEIEIYCYWTTFLTSYQWYSKSKIKQKSLYLIRDYNSETFSSHCISLIGLHFLRNTKKNRKTLSLGHVKYSREKQKKERWRVLFSDLKTCNELNWSSTSKCLIDTRQCRNYKMTWLFSIYYEFISRYGHFSSNDLNLFLNIY